MQFENTIKTYFPQFTNAMVQQFLHSKKLYAHWNQQVNVISRKDIDSFYEHHVLHSLSILEFIHFKPKAQILDLGCGGGFPGIPLAIAFPETDFFLVDSIGKKIKVVAEIASELNLKNVKTIQSRAEELNMKFDFVVCRAVAPLQDLIQWTRNSYKVKSMHVVRNGLLCLKGGDLHQEISDAHHFINTSLKRKATIELYSITDWFSNDFFETKKLVYCSF